MSRNLLDYLYWRGDLSFEQDPLNEIDALLLSEFSYIDFNLLAPDLLKAGKLTIHEAANHWQKADRRRFMPTGFLHHELAYEALSLAGDSNRFKEVLIAEDIKNISAEDESQFGVTAFHQEGKPLFIAFEGTDLRSLGWKEDLQMSYLPMIPSQEQAVAYLNDFFARYPKEVSIGGHSKGGNLAAFASIYVADEFQHLLKKVYSFDSPGFNRAVLEDERYQNVQDRIYSFLPQDSIVGLMLNKLEDMQVVYSHAHDSNQHDVFTWEMRGNQFVPSELTESARQIEALMGDVLDEISLEEREHFSEALFSIIGDSEEDYIIGDRSYNLEQIPRIIRELTNLTQDEKQILLKVLRIFYRKRLQLL